ncbi:DDE-type integrase/transposase/recombinase [Dehalogenimonas alkenigignens]|uniref:DDE-type integrase/transposase/recombinase n=1 Tax=Dehalogenimonas alkenigignens TaxID=1217799 RepID=UPI000D570E5D|nr:DDE-type integrase/transposase/recombinase [Dehalogenimonas alkenigignens]PVV84019.1 IS6 family transposase [Dehalogenimonas alkenigignens]
MNCKHCDSEMIIKYGVQSGTQMYFCKECKRKFKMDDSLFGGKVPADYISSALADYYKGHSVQDICTSLRDEHGYHPSKSVVFKWIDKHTDNAVKHFAKYKPNVGDRWIADETVIDLDGKDVWLWDIIDEKTRFLLASKMSYTRSVADAKILFELAKERAGKSPAEVVSDKLAVYPDAIHEVFGRETFSLQTGPTAKYGNSTNRIERWHSTLKERTKVMRALRDVESALGFTDGFIAYYNFIRPHEGLDGLTPAEAAGIHYDANTWGKVIRLNEPRMIKPEPEYQPSQELAYRRRVITGKPYKPGRKRKPRTSTPIVPQLIITSSKPPKLNTRIPPSVRRQIGMGR